MGGSPGTEENLLEPESKFQFSCHKGLECFTDCCKNAIISLSPYEILRIKNCLGIPSDEFLAKYTGSIIAETGLPMVYLKMSDGENSCPFVGEDGCSIYEERPWTCRSFPLNPEKAKKTTGGPPIMVYSIAKEPTCLGLNEGEESTVRLWRVNQGLDTYNELEEIFNSITFNEVILRNRITEEKVRDMFYMACYDLDRFKRFVFESRFLDIFDIEKDVIEKIKDDDEELLKLGLKWIKYGLIDSEALKLRGGVTRQKA
jgi:hypothetical protein